MNKQTFLDELRASLAGLPQKDVDERIAFYGEMIDDRTEEGLGEEEAVQAIGSVDEIASQIVADMPLTKIAKEKIRPRRKLQPWEIILIILGSPLWVSLLIAAASVIVSLYVSMWSVVVSLWAAFGSLAACGAGLLMSGPEMILDGYISNGLAVTGVGLASAGLAIFTFFGCDAATKFTVKLPKKIILWIKKCFVGKEKE